MDPMGGAQSDLQTQLALEQSELEPNGDEDVIEV